MCLKMYITIELLGERKQFLNNRDYSNNTIENYSSDIKLFFNYLKLENGVHTITENDITLKTIENRKTYLS